ncbi:stage III sporulation protein AF [Paenibacillus soyae]|uniref:Stage III sporulation protein AF n=1 Tax=Paenibacillus soyae TaxID=2969249 RepID=A0A9X2MNW4_9BACL|nr:stage III sporulation protein AF [Paenibacillus soyae]
MIGWLSDWLRDIIAVILLAVLVELLLPNKAMQRYARLVVGLFILLTILSPVLRLIQSDFGDRLHAGMELWDERTMQNEVKMPSLEEIQKRAEAIQTQRMEEAGRMTAAALEESMKQAIEEETGAVIESVDVGLHWDERGNGEKLPEIDNVIVTLAAPKTGADDGKASQPPDIEAVAPVDIRVDVEEDGKTEPAGERAAESNEGYAMPSEQAANAIQGVLARGWGVKPGQTTVRAIPGGAAAG